MRSTRLVLLATCVMALGLGSAPLEAQVATQTVTFKVVPMNRVAMGSASATVAPQRVSTTSSPLKTVVAVAGSSYGIATNESNQKISAALAAPLPSGVTLIVSLAAPKGAATKGAKVLSTRSADMVTGISAVSASDLPVTYMLSAAARTNVVVKYTITAGL
jgi:hypothetical protein